MTGPEDVGEKPPTRASKTAIASAVLGAVLLAGVIGGVLGSQLSGDSSGTTAAHVALRVDNPVVPPGAGFTEILRLELRPGSYQVFGKLELSNRSPRKSFTVQCALVPSNEDGTPRPAGELGSDFEHLELWPVEGDFPSEGALSLAITQELSEAGAVVLGCDGYGNEHGAFANNGSIRAIEVDSVTTEIVPTPDP